MYLTVNDSVLFVALSTSCLSTVKDSETQLYEIMRNEEVAYAQMGASCVWRGLVTYLRRDGRLRRR